VPDDWPRYRELRLRALREDPLAFGSTFDRENQFPPERWQERLGRGKPGSPSTTVIAVGADGHFVGVLAVARVEGQFHLFAMWVAPEVRGQGIGGRLLDRALGWVAALEPGASVHLDVNRGQVAAVRLYESRGFRFTGVSRPIDHTPGVEVSEMARGP
jgi:ribosomal protein S18 acetylase RimI-like enzyme